MPTMKREKTKYEGVTFVVGVSSDGKPENIYYIRYRKNGKLIEEKAGRQFKDDMTPARANQKRLDRMRGKEPTNEERRAGEKAAKEAEQNRWTIDKLWEEYKRQHTLKGLAQDESRYITYLKKEFGEKEPETLASLDIDRLRIRLLKAKRPQTVKNALALLRRIINFGAGKGLCGKPAFTIQMPTKINNVKTEDLSDTELILLLEALDKDPDKQAANLMRFVLCTGMRRGELFRLKWEDIDFERGYIHIRDPKGGKDETIPLNESAKTILDNHPRLEDSMFVFPGRKGNQRVEIRKAANRIKKAAKLPADFRPLHGLRHTYASMLASSGQVDLYTLQKLLTHKSPEMTQRYAHLRDGALRKASDLAGCLIEQAMNGKDKEADSSEAV
ncbi:MAG: site-specific integrase [Syntrophobacteraceae bacterium]